jgi:hypothetical protein
MIAMAGSVSITEQPVTTAHLFIKSGQNLMASVWVRTCGTSVVMILGQPMCPTIAQLKIIANKLISREDQPSGSCNTSAITRKGNSGMGTMVFSSSGREETQTFLVTMDKMGTKVCPSTIRITPITSPSANAMFH